MSFCISKKSKSQYDGYIKQRQKPLWDKTCLFEAGQANNINGNMFALVRTLRKCDKFDDYNVAFSVCSRTKKMAQKRFAAYGIDKTHLVMRNSDEYKSYLARSKYLFTDNSFPPWFTKRPDQIYVNTWHGTPLKRLGFSDIENSLKSFGNVQKNLLTADYLLFPNDYTRDIFMDDYGLAPVYTGTVLRGDYPRNDALGNGKLRTQVRKKTGIASDCLAIAYMPTWRGSGRTQDAEGQTREICAYLDGIDKLLKDDQILFVNLHFLVYTNIDFSSYEHVRPFPDSYETYDFLAACDMLVTDYSSVMFDYATTGRPVCLFAYDEDVYVTEKGMYFPYRNLPFPVANTIDELVTLINKYSHGMDYETFTGRFCSRHCGHAAKALLDYVLLGKQGPFDVELCRPQTIDQAFYLYDLGNTKALDAALPFIKANATEHSLLITTSLFTDEVARIVRRLQGKIDIVLTAKAPVQTTQERKLFKCLQKHGTLFTQKRKETLHECFCREARRLLPGISFDRFIALDPDGSYLMWVATGIDCRREVVDKYPTLSKKVGICVAQGYTISQDV